MPDRSHEFELPEDWGDPISELRAKCEGLPEDEEDRWAREEDQLRHDSLPPEVHAALSRRFDEMLQRMQEPGAMAKVDAVFRRDVPVLKKD